MEELQTNMQKDNWDAAIVPYDFTQVLSFIFDFDQNTLEETESVFLNTHKIGGIEMPILTGEEGFNPDETIDITNFKNKQVSKKIMILKKEVHIENRRFLVSQSFMFLMRNIYEYLKFVATKKFKDLDAIGKIKDIIMVYKSVTYQLIISGGSVMTGSVTQITTKILALSITETRFLNLVIEKIADILVTSKSQSESLNGYLQLIFNMKSDIEVHRKNIVSKILDIVQAEFKKAGDTLKEIPWNQSGQRVTIPTNNMSKIIFITKQMLRSVDEILDKDDLKGIFTEIIYEVERSF